MNASRAGRFGKRTAAARATPARVPWMRRATKMAARGVQTAAVSGNAAAEQGDCFVSVVLLAGGVGKRMGAGMPKQYLPLQGRPMAMHSLETFRGIGKIRDIVVVCDESYDDMFLEHDASLAHAGKEPLRFARPGKERQDSVFNGLQEISSDAELVAVHDSARPLVTAEEVDRVVGDALRHGAAVLGVRTKATIKEVGDGNLVTRTLDRSMLWEMHTPQVMRPGLLRRGYELVQREGLEVTDDVSIVEHTGEPVKVTEGEYTNIKLTTPDDIVIAERILANREADASSLSLSSS